MPIPETGAAMTTAITDLINALALAPMVFFLRRKMPRSSSQTALWLRLMSILAMASLLGFILHGFQWGRTGWIVCWALLYPMLFAALYAFLALGWHTYSRGSGPSRSQARWLRLGMTAIYLLFLFLLLADINPIRYFVIYGIFIAIPALYFFGKTAFRGHRGARLLCLAMLPQLPGLVIQLACKRGLPVLGCFDSNGLYHIFLLISLAIAFFAALAWEE